jgi:GNAT superfamily N-acetyltransferase
MANIWVMSQSCLAGLFHRKADNPNCMSFYSIRLAREQDCAELARLASQLGYPTTRETMQARLQKLLGSPNDVIFVAEAADGGLAGWIHGFLSQLLESDYQAEIGGLIVDERFHRRGIGRDLVKSVEDWAAAHGAKVATVRCRTTRTEAHRFYESLGFSQAKTQIVFRKPLPPP